MIINSLNGDDQINELANAAMHATISALRAEGALTKEQGDVFLEDHICMFVTKNGGFKGWLKQFFGKETASVLMVFKASCIK